MTMSFAFLLKSALSSSSLSSHSELSWSLMSLTKFSRNTSVKPSIVKKFVVESYVLARDEITSNGAIDGNPETTASNASYIPASFKQFMMIDCLGGYFIEILN